MQGKLCMRAFDGTELDWDGGTLIMTDRTWLVFVGSYFTTLHICTHGLFNLN